MQERNLAKAKLIQLKPDFSNPKDDPAYEVTVQFNPELLKLNFQNQISAGNRGDQRGTETRLFVGAGTTKLSLQLWFDVSAPLPTDAQSGSGGGGAGGGGDAGDVRKLTGRVAHFITPQKEGDAFVPPAVRFLWGTFQFDGVMESMEESLEFFSPDGRPLRASVSIGLSQQAITEVTPGKAGAARSVGGGRPASPGTRPLSPAALNDTLQGLTAAGGGAGAGWQAVAAANGIENPLRLSPGQLIDTAAGAGGRGGLVFGSRG